MAIPMCALIIFFHALYNNKFKIWPLSEEQNKIMP